MTPAELLKPILGGGIRSVNFFNGRLLSGEDMSREQEANREAHKMLGRAIGDGIAYGLEVSRAPGPATNAIVTVQPGLAINRNGETLRLSSPISLSLVRPQNGSGSAIDGGFSSCTPFQSGVYVSGSGVYLLTVSPAKVTEGRAAATGLQNSAADGNTKYLVDGVQFRLIPLELSADELNDQNHLRNLVAYRCLGAANRTSFVTDPFGAEVALYGLLDSLRPKRLTDCDVPLGVLFWTASDGIQFVDMWSVRRRFINPMVAGQLDSAISDRRRREGEATFLQFQDHLAAIRQTNANPQLIRATAHFHSLPPIGFIPLGGIKSSTGFDYLRFFSGLKYRNPVFIEGTKVEPLVRAALSYAPIDLSSEELIWLYRVRENMQSVDKGGLVQPYMIFATGHTVYQGDARYDLARWDYSNYSLRRP